MKNSSRVMFALIISMLTKYAVFAEQPKWLPQKSDIPKEMAFYNSKEPGFFRINCNQARSKSISCNVEQLFFIEKSDDGSCAISWTHHIENFKLNINNHTWNSTKEQNTECGIINFSSLSKRKDGYWSYRFGNRTRFPNKKTNGLIKTSCHVYENNKGIEYTSKYMPLNLKCNSFTLLPF